jgi:transposase
MFIRIKSSGEYKYLQIVENSREGKKVKQKILFTLGRLDILNEKNKIDGLASSILQFTNKLKVIDMYKQNQVMIINDISIGPALVFDKIWNDLGLPDIINELSTNRKYKFDLERAIFLTVLHRLFNPGSDRAAEKWKDDIYIKGASDIKLHHLYRAMAWLGEGTINILSGNKSFIDSIKDKIEHLLFEKKRDLFSSLQVVFFDTTSIYFEGEGGQTIGKRGYSKDNRPDLKQMIVGVVMDSYGNPICCEMLPGNTADIKTLLPVIIKIKQRFAVNSFCIVADRGMISKEIIKTLESHSFTIEYILGCRMRKEKKIKEEIMKNASGGYKKVYIERKNIKKALALEVKEVAIDGKRYIICHNTEQAQKDKADRDAIIESLQEKLKCGNKSLIGNKGYRKYLKSSIKGELVFEIDEIKLKTEELFDGKWVLRTNTHFPAEEIAIQYKQLWMVEQAFRTVKSVLETRPIYHKCDESIRGHIFCSFLALVLMKELFYRLETKKEHYEWADIKRDVEALRQVELQMNKDTYFLRTELRGTCYDVLQAAGVAVPSRVRQ